MPRVLVIDDHIATCAQVAHLLRMLHYSTDGAYSASAAMQHLGTLGTDLVIINLELPDHEGWKLLEWMRTQPRLARTRIIVHSVLSPEQWQHAKRLGAAELWVRGVCCFNSMCDSLERHFPPAERWAA